MESLSKGNFTMRILYEQLANVQKMGSVGQIMSMIPGLSNSGLFNKVCCWRIQQGRGDGYYINRIFLHGSEVAWELTAQALTAQAASHIT